MPSKAQKQRGALLPAVLPVDTICVKFECPDDELIIAAVKGAIWNLAKWYAWEKPQQPDDRNVRIVAQFTELLETTLTVGDCTVIDCDTIQNCLDIQDPPPRKTPPQYMLDEMLDLLNLSGTCSDADKDKIFGYTTQIVDFMNTAITDLFEKIEIITNFFELMNEVVGSVPVIGRLLTLVSEMVSFLQNTVGELYLAGFDTEERDYIRCQLFCLAVRNNCSLTLEDIHGWLEGEIGNVIRGEDVNDFAEWFVSLGVAIPKRLIVLAMFSMVTWALAWGSEFIGIGNAARFIKILKSLLNDPDPDWMTICDDCGFCIIYDFTLDSYQDDWQPVYPILTTAPSANYAIGAGFVHQDIIEDVTDDSASRMVGLTNSVDFAAANATVKRIMIYYTWTYGNSANGNAHSAIADDLTPLLAHTITFGAKPPNGNVIRDIAIDRQFSGLGVLIRSSTEGAPSNNYSGAVTITKIRIEGTGEVPAHHGVNC